MSRVYAFPAYHPNLTRRSITGGRRHLSAAFPAYHKEGSGTNSGICAERGRFAVDAVVVSFFLTPTPDFPVCRRGVWTNLQALNAKP